MSSKEAVTAVAEIMSAPTTRTQDADIIDRHFAPLRQQLADAKAALAGAESLATKRGAELTAARDVAGRLREECYAASELLRDGDTAEAAKHLGAALSPAPATCKESLQVAAPTGVSLIAAEQARVRAKGRDAAHDDEHADGSIAELAADIVSQESVVDLPDWACEISHRILVKHRNNRVQQLVIAGQLIASEIDRLLRAETKAGKATPIIVADNDGAERAFAPTPPTILPSLLTPPTTDRDWTEDFAHENGQYLCKCSCCGQQFTGHKRRVVCKLCIKATPPTVPGQASPTGDSPPAGGADHIGDATDMPDLAAWRALREWLWWQVDTIPRNNAVAAIDALLTEGTKS